MFPLKSSQSSHLTSMPISDLTAKIVRSDNLQYCAGGAFGDVFQCRCASDDGVKEVAVKAFRFGFFVGDSEHKCDGEKATRTIRRELGIWSRLSHRNIVPFLGITYGFGRQGNASLVSVWMPHGTLHTFLAAHGDRLAVAHRLQLLLDIANGLHYLHSFPTQVIHGDLTSNNVLLDHNYTACLTDFGCASLIGELPEGHTYLKASTVRPGTLRWAAPERFSSSQEETKQTIKRDIYSFGNMALLVLSGKYPWSEVPNDGAVMRCLLQGIKPARPLSRPIDDQYWALIERCWSSIPERPLAKDLVASLKRFLGAYAPDPTLRDLLDVPIRSSSVPNCPGNDDLENNLAPNRIESQQNPASSALGAADVYPPKLVDRKVRALLSKLTMEKFDPISDQIIAWVNKSVNEKDGRTLIQVIRLVFEKATNGTAQSEICARLCRKMMETISPEVQDDDIRNSEGKPIPGGQLFRKYLLNRCQEDFERGWVAKETTAAAAAAKASDDQTVKAANEKKGDESELYSDEYYAAQKAKRQGLGLIKFIGELFKLQMLTERIMHECVKKLLGNVENPEEEEIESLCLLLKTVGQQLDVPKARAHMDVYFTRMKELCKNLNVSPRMQFMLQDVIELRDRKWAARGAVVVPTTLSVVHELAAKEKAAAEAQSYRQLPMSRGGSRRGGDRNVESGPDGWTTAGGLVARPQPKAGDLSQFGKINKTTQMVMGPSSVFTKKDAKRESLSRTSSNSNMFSMLSQSPGLVVDTTARPSQYPSRKPFIDPGHTGAREPPQRRKLQLLPRTKPTPVEELSPPASEEEPEVSVQMSEADAKKKIDEDVKEFFAIRSLEEADVYFTNLPEEHRFRLVDKLVGSILEGKEADAALVAEFFARAASKSQCSPEVFEAGFMPMAELLDDTAIDAPNAFKFMAIILKGAGFDKDQERLVRLSSKSMDSEKLLQLVSS